MVSVKTFKEAFPKAKDPIEWAELLNTYLPQFGINITGQEAMFLAQCGHESGGFTVFEENLNYSAQRLLAVFPKYFKTLEEAMVYNRNKMAIANKVYAYRMGNGAPSTGDGYRYRGRGLIQLTGKDNYIKFFKDCKKDYELVDVPDKVSTDKKYALLSALWFWQKNNLQNVYEIEHSTKIINGGLNGLEDRKARYANIYFLLEG